MTLDFEKDSKQYWDFSLKELATYDTPAAVEYVYNQNNGEKIIMVNNSNGSTVSHYALSTVLEESFFEQRVEKAIQTAPCTTLINFEFFTAGIPITVEHIAMLYDTGFTHFGGELLSPFMAGIERFCSSSFG